MKTPHKHCELIKAWADGVTIQILNKVGIWLDTAYNCPLWSEDRQYRIKPEPKPDVVEWRMLPRNGCTPTPPPNIKLTFDGETGKLKSAEVIS